MSRRGSVKYIRKYGYAKVDRICKSYLATYVPELYGKRN